jgi:hypothetical protein
MKGIGLWYISGAVQDDIVNEFVSSISVSNFSVSVERVDEYPMPIRLAQNRRIPRVREATGLNTGKALESLQSVRIPTKCVAQRCLSKKLLKTQ